MVAFGPHQPDSNPFAAHLNRAPKYVATRMLDTLTWDGAAILQGDMFYAVDELRRDDAGIIGILGSGPLTRELIRHELVDEYRLFLHPPLLGTEDGCSANYPHRSHCA